jgi:hypothetical protein
VLRDSPRTAAIARGPNVGMHQIDGSLVRVRVFTCDEVNISMVEGSHRHSGVWSKPWQE